MLQIFITNTIRVRGASVPLSAAITKALTMDNPAYEERKKRKLPTWGMEKRLQLYIRQGADIIIPRGWKSQLLELLCSQGITPEKVISEHHTETEPIDFGPWNPEYEIGVAPREYQREAVDKAIAAGGGVLVSPAGSGKTAMGMYIVRAWGQRALWLTHTIDLLEQAKAAAEKYMPGVGRVGVLGGGSRDYGDGKLIVATVQTLQSMPQLITSLNDVIGTVVVDEAHHFPAPAFVDVAGQFKAKYMLGVTATPERKDRLEAYLYAGIGPICHEVMRSGMYDAGAIIKPEIRFIYTRFNKETASDRTEIESVDAGGDDMDYVDLLDALIKDESRMKLVTETILDHISLGPAIVISERLEYCHTLETQVKRLAAERYRGMQLRTAVLHGKLPKAERTAILEAARQREVDILFATQVAREGLDIPHLTVGHMVTPKRGDTGKSKTGSALEQEIGRIMRPDPKNPNKKAVWFDYVDYEVGVFQSQYNTRRATYRRLDLQLPKKPKTEREKIEDFLTNTKIFDSLPY